MGQAVYDDLIGIWEHYKGKHYEVIGVAHHSETQEELVVYKALYTTVFGDDSLWVRPKTMFLETIEINGLSKARFVKIGTKEKAHEKTN